MDTLLRRNTSNALIGCSDGTITAVDISRQLSPADVLELFDSLYSKPRHADRRVVLLADLPPPRLVTSWHHYPIDVDQMIRDVVAHKPRVIPRPLMPKITTRCIELHQYATLPTLSVWCAFDAPTGEWWVWDGRDR